MSDEQTLIEFVQCELARGKEVKGLRLDDNLIDSGILDSLGIMKLILFLEEKFGIKITDEDLSPENFGTIQAIHALVARKGSAVGATR